MFSISLHRANHIRRYSVSAASGSGWEVRLENDRALTRLEHYQDWHRVERIVAAFRREVSELTEQGWQIES
jgi:hypothetical protein